MGKNGRMLWKRANGIDNTPICRYSERKSISTERIFEKDTIDVIYLRQLLTTMIEKIAFELRTKEKLASVVTVKIRYANFDTHSMQRHISYTSLYHQLLAIALELFEKLYQRRMLIRLVGVHFSGLVGGTHQLDIFEDAENPTLSGYGRYPKAFWEKSSGTCGGFLKSLLLQFQNEI